LGRSQTGVFFATLYRASPPLTLAWWAVLVLSGLAPTAFAIATGLVIGAVDDDRALDGPLTFLGVTFVVLQVLAPVHSALSMTLGRKAASWMNDRLLVATTEPPGLAHLESDELADELTMARDFDLGITGPPLFVSMGFIARGLIQLLAGVSAAVVLFAFTWWAPLVLGGAWASTHWLLRESGIWKDRNTEPVRKAQRHADYAYRLAVDAPAAKEIRLFGLANWVIDRFAHRRRELFELQWEATRLRERSVLSSVVVVTAANGLVFWRLASALADGGLDLGRAAVFIVAAIATSSIAFGGLSWALDASSAPAAAVERLGPAMGPAGALPLGTEPTAGLPGREIRFEEVSFTYPTGSAPVLDGLDLVIEAGTSVAIVGQNGAGKTTLAKLLCRFYDPTEGAITVDGTDLRHLGLDQWRGRVTAVFQDFVRYQKSLRFNVAPRGASDEDIVAALEAAGADGLADLDTVLARGYPGGIELSGGQWQRVALARALCGVRQGAGLVLLDEPTAQLDVRGEAEIFRRLIETTRHCTTILVSHRFSTVRHADRIIVVEEGRVIEDGSHDELMALGGRYRAMYELQASRFIEIDDQGEQVVYDTLT
jgi:ABC-type multidrug transport system fused ATPase/permease subunit